MSVNCNTEFWSLSSDELCGYIKTQGLIALKLGLDGSGQGPMIFLKMSLRTQHNYL